MKTLISDKVLTLCARQWQRLAEIQQIQMEMLEDVSQVNRRRRLAVSSKIRRAKANRAGGDGQSGS